MKNVKHAMQNEELSRILTLILAVGEQCFKRTPRVVLEALSMRH
jgi:hypothetical protein